MNHMCKTDAFEPVVGSLDEAVLELIAKSRDPFIYQKLVEKAGGDVGNLSLSQARVVFEIAEDDINRQHLGELFREKYGSRL